jgi:hypothetical protein
MGHKAVLFALASSFNEALDRRMKASQIAQQGRDCAFPELTFKESGVREVGFAH